MQLRSVIFFILVVWFLITSAGFLWLDYCYFSHRVQESPPINYVHVTLGVIGEFVHMTLCVVMIWFVRKGAIVSRENLFYAALLLLVFVFSPLAVRHGALKGNEEKPIFFGDPCICFLR